MASTAEMTVPRKARFSSSATPRIVVPPGEGYYDENGNWVPVGETDPTDPTDPEGSEEVSPERGTDFLNWLLNTAA